MVKARTAIPPYVFAWLAVLLACLSSPPLTLAALDPGRLLTQYVHQSWQTDAGLPQNSVYSIAQTPEGYVWIGTESGLARFDGVRFEVFNRANTPVLGTDMITALKVDHEGTLWVGTAAGLLSYRERKFQPFKIAANIWHGKVSCLYEDEQHGLWIGTDGSGILRKQGDSANAFTRADGLPDDAVYAVTGNHRGSIWIGTLHGLVQTGIDRFTPVPIAALQNAPVHALQLDREGVLWIGTYGNGLFSYAFERTQRFTTADGLSSNAISALCEDDGGTLWIGTSDSGLNRLVGARFESFSRKQAAGEGIVSLFEDRSGALWVGGTASGLSLYRNGLITPWGKPEGLPNEMNLGLYQDREGALWVGSADGLMVLDRNGIRRFTTREGLPHPNVFSIAQDGRGTIWAGTRFGLARLRGSRFEALKSAGGVDLASTMLAVYTDRRGRIWAGGRALVVMIDGDKVTTYGAQNGLPSQAVTCMYEDAAGILWIGTDGGGLLRFQDGSSTALTTETGFPSNSVTYVTGENDGTLWIATRDAGLVRMARGKTISFGRSAGLAEDSVTSIVDDRNGRLWMSSDDGILSVSKHDLNSFVEGRIKHIDSTLYGTPDGMRTRECNGGFQGAALRTRDGRLWFSTQKGLASLLPSTVHPPQLDSPVLMERLAAGEKPIPLSDNVQIQPHTQQIEFQFTLPYFAAPERLQFQYQLSGFDKEWVHAGSRRSAYYTNLPAGTYEFRPTACLGKVCTPVAGIRVTVLPAFYETKLFALAAVLAAGGILFLLDRIRVRRVRAKEGTLQRLIDARTQELREARDQLESRVIERTRELLDANEHLANEIAVRRAAEQKAEAASRAKSEFLANMSHELRTPMNGVIGMTELALQMSTNTDQRDYLRLVSQSADHLLSVLNDILDFSKIEFNKLLLEDLEFDLPELLNRLVQTLEPVASDKGLVLIGELAPDLPWKVMGDPTRLRQVLFNLVGNAIKFTETGRVEVEAYRVGPDEIGFAVTDTGIGIPLEKQKKIFDCFEQVDGGTARKFGGTGLGLAISSRLVELMGGKMEVKSEIGVGSRFTFSARLRKVERPTLTPLAEATLAASATLALDDMTADCASGLRVLVAEDNAINQRLAKAVLEKAGYRVKVVSDGSAAVAAHAEEKFDLILMDVQMPGMDGLAATSAIREAENGRDHIPIIALTAHAMQGDRERCMAAGMDDYMTKPIDIKQLTARLNTLLTAV
jgi:signal transduction histidine kinase/ligand-binding sensor domain-containing protein/CheY-like chemotaxis protein